MSLVASLERAAQLVSRAHRGVAFTGAGVSAESGIRTFRGEGGLWTQYDPFKVSSIDFFLQDPAAYWSVSKERYETYRHARPNAGHLSLAAMEEAGVLQAGAPLVIVNAEPTPLDEMADAVIRGRAGEVLPRLLELSGR